VRWELRPVVYAALLEDHGLVGPVETAAKRRYTIHDVARSARRLGLRLVGPPAHPFRSIEALRTLVLFRDDPRALRLAVALSDACWSGGRALTDLGVLSGVVSGVGLDAADLGERIAAGPIKEALRRSTDEALAQGVFGVPTFVLDGELFWGHDRMDQLAGRLSGEPPAFADAEPMLARPAGVVRRR
jgi:2-hydroxychromene-2-carboxylate isomerase